MPIRLVCTCGKGFQVLNSKPGQKFKCTACGEIVAVPAKKTAMKPAQLESVDDYEEEPEDELEPLNYEAPFRREKKRRSANWGRSCGNGQALRVTGIIGAVLGYLLSVLMAFGAIL